MPPETDHALVETDHGVAVRSTADKELDTYEAFISYNSNDRAIAEALDATLERLGKSWMARRRLRVARDATTFEVTAALPSAIERFLQRSKFLVVVVSPDAAESEWVNREASWWLEHKSIDRLLIVLADGELRWDARAHGYSSDSYRTLPPALRTCFSEEPKHLDLRWARAVGSRAVRDKNFTEAVAELAAAILGTTKDEVLGIHRRERRRRRLLVCVAVISIVLVPILFAVLRLLGQHLTDLAARTSQVMQKSRDYPDVTNDRVDLGAQAVRSLELLKRLRLTRKDFPTLMARAHERYGNAVGDPYGPNAGDPTAAAESFERSLRGLEGLPEADQLNIENRRARVHALLGLAMARFDLGESDASVEILDKAITDAQASLIAGDFGVLHDLWIGHYRRGDVRLKLNRDLTKSEADLGDCLAILEELRHIAPDFEPYARNEAQTRGTLAAVYANQGNSAAAMREITTGIQILVDFETRTNHPGQQLESDLAVARATLASILLDQGKVQEAASIFEMVLDVERRIANGDASNIQVRRNLAVHGRIAGAIYVDIDDSSRALKAYEDAANAIQVVAAKVPHAFTPEWLAELWVEYADALLNVDRFGSAAALYQYVLDNTTDSLAIRDSRAHAMERLALLKTRGVAPGSR